MLARHPRSSPSCPLGELSFLSKDLFPLLKELWVLFSLSRSRSRYKLTKFCSTFFGALLSAPAADMLGRRWAMIFNTGVFTFGVILQTISVDIPLFVAGRF